MYYFQIDQEEETVRVTLDAIKRGDFIHIPLPEKHWTIQKKDGVYLISLKDATALKKSSEGDEGEER